MPTAASAMPGQASSGMGSPSAIRAKTAVQGGTRKNSADTREASPCRIIVSSKRRQQRAGPFDAHRFQPEGQRRRYGQPDGVLHQVGRDGVRLRAIALFIEGAARDAKQRAHGEQQSQRRQHVDGRLGDDDERGARDPQAQAGPTPGIHAFMRDQGRQQPDQDRLQRGDQRHAARRHAQLQREIGATEVAGLQ
ncbi:hypothetical protein G6F57_012635 [Rhizopus arrhizus]|nr:hypothetical protein G6F57_012635 [Rhizopus arrhizus]